MQPTVTRLERWRTALSQVEWPIATAAVLMAAALALAIWPEDPQVASSEARPSQPMPPLPPGPPWTRGRSDARFTITVYADLECPYCRDYVPELVRWIDATPDVNLQWHHLPLQAHEPAASQEARLAECAGKERGHAGFWQAVDWIYAHTRAESRAVPDGTLYPGMTPKIQACASGEESKTSVSQQAQQAAADGITGTPTLRLRDRKSGKELRLTGAVPADALMSALDLLASPAPAR
ncbi:protein-disulfide isomerase [Xanthomonas sacchari]|uniref:DsbA family protein n=1 Tax=unclassified Xanthomonas TaxID=2643310 RepID=UPI00136F825F|nr:MULTISPECIES: thioredoxin domain-containing protein [unclassified Xanthomonas]MBB6366704.1 protein-disulfide isomerase [Xanthomonas sp. F10]MXV34085.1 DsbA family protein [Xanthomonas sp. LMG 8989]